MPAKTYNDINSKPQQKQRLGTVNNLEDLENTITEAAIFVSDVITT